MKNLLFCLFLLAASSGIRAADKPTLADAYTGEIEDSETIYYPTYNDLENFKKYLTFETFQKNLNGRQWLTLIKPSGSLLSVYVPTIRYQKFPYSTAFALKGKDENNYKVLQISFDYTSKSSDTGTIGLQIESCDSITHYKRLDYSSANALVKLYAEALQQEDASRECRKE